MKKRGIAFLNKPGDFNEGTIAWSVSPDGSFIAVSDCSRKISLSIECYPPDDDRARYKKGFLNSIYKVDTLIRELESCRKALIENGEKQGYLQ